ncbi:MAG: hypothetical protein J0H74_35105 [Chitinophagaceae bacterium]|nr:hypothetical protein [Chitinophagaceae bacterium]
MRWEDLKVYKNLSKEELKPAYKAFGRIIADNMSPFGFQPFGRKLVRLSNDIVQVIHVDTRGSWTGIDEYFETEISLEPVSDKSSFIRKSEPRPAKKMEEITKGIRNHYRITREYELLADYLTRHIRQSILPYFEQYDSSANVLRSLKDIKPNGQPFGYDGLILFCELQNKVNVHAAGILDSSISQIRNFNPQSEYLAELHLYREGLRANDWTAIDEKLSANRAEVLKKLKL